MRKEIKLFLIATGALLLYGALVWLLTSVLDLGPNAAVVRSVMMGVGLIVVSALVVYYQDRLTGTAEGAEGTPAAAGTDADIDAVMAAARERLSSSQVAGRVSLERLPMVVLLGPEGSTKTTTVVRSGLEPELLAGDVFRGETVAPTPVVNVWIAAKTIFLEAGGRLSADAARWASVVKHAQPRRLGAALGRGSQAPRVALVCYSCESLLGAGGGEQAAADGRLLRAQLLELSQRLGVRLPVYVLFTKADRIPHFAAFVERLSKEEAAEVLGATFPADDGPHGGYADRMAARLQQAFGRLFQSLAAWRIPLLAREHALDRRLSAYEFPRELRKLEAAATPFLIELCRPSQLQVNPFLRGVYITGVQAVIINEPAPGAGLAPGVATTPAAPGVVKATGVFDSRSISAAATPGARPLGAQVARKIPRWDFLERVLRDVILADKSAMDATRGGTRVNLLRRIGLATLGALALGAATAFTISYAGNRRLQRETAELARATSAYAPGQAELPAVDALRRLDSLRAILAKLRTYDSVGAPWRLRWGLYSGDALIPEARRAYFAGLDRIGLGPTRETVAEALRALPETPGATADYGPAYALLKAHLITTVEAPRSTPEFLTPVLMGRWLAGRDLDTARAMLVKRQLDYYGDELRRYGDPYGPGTADAIGVPRARAFLAKFAGSGEGIYQFMLSEAAKGNPPVRLAQRVPGAVGHVADPYEVPGAFTKPGWSFMQAAFRSADRYFAGESWVVGEQAGPPVDRVAVISQLRARYAADYLRHWRGFVRSASVVRYSNLRDAAQKLQVLSGNQSPVLALLSITAQNTDVDSVTAAAFQPVHAVTPPKITDKLIGETNGGYVNALVGLQAALEQAAAAPPGQGDAAVGQASGAAQQAKTAARQLAQAFRIDPEAHLETAVQRLLEDPVTNAEPLLKNFGATELNAGGSSFCGSFRQLMAKYPFNPSPTAPQATLGEVNTVFRPLTGALWTFYASTLQNTLVKQGSQYVPKPGGSAPVSPAFVEFFNRAASVTDALYKEGSAEPKLTFSLKPLLSEVTSAVSITIDGQTAITSRNSTQTRQMEWPGAGVRDARVSATIGGADVVLLSYEGPWAAFRLFQEAETWTTAGAAHRLEWTLRTRGQQATLADGTPVKVAAELNLGATQPVFRRGYFAGLNCVSTVAR